MVVFTFQILYHMYFVTVHFEMTSPEAITPFIRTGRDIAKEDVSG